MNTKTGLILAGCAVAAAAWGAGPFWFHTTVEKERPQLSETTRRLIAEYRRNPTPENKAALREQIAANYDRVIERKKAKLEELKRTARHQSKVREMEEIVNEVVRDRETRIEQSLRRFTDPRLRPGSRETADGYLPILGAAANVAIAYAPVTVADYQKFVAATKRKPPKDWANGVAPSEKSNHPVVNVTCADAEAYCRWLSAQDKTAVYRLPTAEEWELAAGHMPKDADLNNGARGGTSPVDAHVETRAACGAVDMWGNCWEMTSTPAAGNGGARKIAVKGGSFQSPRLKCRTEERGEFRARTAAAPDLTFRVVRE